MNTLIGALVAVNGSYALRFIFPHLVDIGAVHNGGRKQRNLILRVLQHVLVPDDGHELHARKDRTAIIVHISRRRRERLRVERGHRKDVIAADDKSIGRGGE